MFPGFDAFLYRKGRNYECSDGVGPPPLKPGVQADAKQGGGRDEGAEGAFGGIGHEGPVAQRLPSTPFGQGQQRHDQQGRHGYDEPGHGLFWLYVTGQISDALDREVGGEHEERYADETDGAGLAFVTVTA